MPLSSRLSIVGHVAALWLGIVTGPSWGTTTTFVPVADTEVRSDLPALNFGTATSMEVDGSPVKTAYLRFNVSVPAGEVVTQATLRLFTTSSSSRSVFANQVASTTWGETTTTFGNAPALGAKVATSGAFSSNSYISMDVSQAVTGGGLVSLAVTRNYRASVKFNSREAAANRPQLVVTSSPSAPPPPPPPPDLPPTVSADALPTWQINGVVWSQVVVGNIVYATGSFTKARPPGVAAGGAGEVDAQNIFAYDIATGQRVSTFNHALNGQGLAIAASPDGSRVYVAGDFTAVDGFARGHVASFQTASGALDPNFAPTVQGKVTALAVASTKVFVGGAFGTVNGQSRKSLAALDAINGSPLPWAPTVDNGRVWAMVLAPDQSRVIVGGSFTTINGQAAYGMGSVDATTSISLPWAANQKIRDAGDNAAIYSLRADGTQIYGTAYTYGGGGNFEGTFAANPTTGAISVVNDCHGDTYDVLPLGGVMYSVGHAHDCSWIRSFPDTDPRVRWQRALAQTIAPFTTNIGPDNYGWNYSGWPASKILHWFPRLAAGSYTGAYQAAWSLAGNSNYIVLGGEFPQVNGVAQQGLVRMAVRALAPNKVGPTYTTTPSRPLPPTTATSTSSGTVRVSFGTAWDYDNELLKYELFRNGIGPPIYTTQLSSNFWTLPTATYTDTGVPPGTTAYYQVRITDPNGNTLWSLKSDTITVCCTATQQQAIALTGTGPGRSALAVSRVGLEGAARATAKRRYIDPLASRRYQPVRRKGQTAKSIRVPGSNASFKVSAAVRYSDRVVVSIRNMSSGVETGRGGGAFPGRPYTAVTFNIRNHSVRPLDLNQVVVTAQYGSPALIAYPVYNALLARDFAGVLQSGKSASATYLFAVPPQAAHSIATIVDLDGSHGPARFSVVH